MTIRATMITERDNMSEIGSMASSEDADRAFAGLYELFSKPLKSPQKRFRTYHLSFENGEPVFTLSEADRIVDEIFEEMFGPRSD